MTTQSQAGGQAASAKRARAGVLLVHGLNGSVRDMVEIEDMLRRDGLVTRNLLLPGHGSHVRELLPLGWPEWAAEVRAAYRGLRHQCERVFLVGHSLGGALCLHTAAHEEVAGIVSMCAPVTMPV
jgi:carboxylesterase